MNDKAEAIQQIENSREGLAEPTTKWVTFRLDDEKYAMRVAEVREVLRELELAPVPGAPDFVLGIINLRGNVVTVVDTRKRFALSPREADEQTRILIIESGEQVVGMMVDSVEEVTDLADSQIETAPNVGNDESAKYIQGVANQEDELLILVDLKKMLSEGHPEDEGARH